MINSENSKRLEEKLNDDVQFIYRGLLRNGLLVDAQELKKRSKIKPHAKMVQEVYSDVIGSGSPNWIKSLKEFTKIEPDFSREYMKEAVQEGYLVCFKHRWVDRLKILKEIGGVVPDYCRKGMKEAVQEGYLWALKDCEFDNVRGLNDFTGIEPSEELKKRFWSGKNE